MKFQEPPKKKDCCAEQLAALRHGMRTAQDMMGRVAIKRAMCECATEWEYCWSSLEQAWIACRVSTHEYTED